MKRILFFLSLLVVMTQEIYATHIVKAPGSMTDVFTELPIRGVLDADTIFVDGGTGDIYLKAGPADDGISYSWAVGAGNYYTYSVTFTYADADVTFPDGSKGSLVSVIRSNPDQSQYVYVVYRFLPLKPSTPSGSTSVCTGTSTNYSSTGANATSYQWYISNPAAGTLSNATSGTVTVNWTAGWTGDVELTVKGIKDATQSPLSDPLEVTVGTVPTKPTITGDHFVEKASSIIYTGNSVAATTWTWTMTPNTLATATPSGQNVTIDFTATGTFSLTTQSHNTCGDSEVSDGFNVEIVDIGDLEAENAQLEVDTALYRKQVRDSTVIINQLRLTNSDLLQDLQDSSLIISGLEQKLVDSTAVISGLRLDLYQAVADSTAAGIAYRNTIDALKLANTTLQTNYNQTVTDSTAAGIAYRNTISALNLANTTLQGNYNQAVADSTAAGIAYRNTIGALKLTNTTLQTNYNQAVADSTAAGIAYRNTISALNLANTTLQGEIDDLNQQIDDLEQQVLDLQALIDGGMQDLLDQIDQLEAEKLALQGQIDALTTTNTNLQGQVTDLTAANTTLTGQLATVTQERDNALARINAIATLLGVDVADIEDQISVLKQVYILSWEVTEVVTSVFETEIGKFTISLYPNPSPGEVFIECTEEIKEVKIFTLQGTLIKQFTVNNTETSFVVARNEMSVGTYIVHIQTTKGTSTHKIIFQ